MTAPEPTPPQLCEHPFRLALRVCDTARALGVSEPTLHHLRKTDPDFPRPFAYEENGDRKFSVRALEEYVALKEARAAAEREEREAAQARRPEIEKAVRRVRAK